MKKGSKKTSRSEDEHSGQVVRGGKYRRKDIPSGHVAGKRFYSKTKIKLIVMKYSYS